MVESNLFQLILTQTGLGGIAIFAMWLLNRTYVDALRREREYAETLRADRAELLAVSRDLTKTMAGLENAVQTLTNELHRTANPRN